MSKSIPYSLLTFVAASSLLFAQDGKGWTAYKPGSGLSYDGGDAFGLKWSNFLQVHWTYMALDNGTADTSTFNVRRARTTFSGHAFSKDILFKLQLDGVDAGAAGDGALKEGHVTYNFSKSEDSAIGLRVGQGKTMYGLEGTQSSSGTWFVETSAASSAFAGAYSRGAWITGGLNMKDKPVRFAVGAMNTDTAAGLGSGYTDRGEETANSDNELSYVLTANFDPLGDFFDGAQTVEGKQQGDWRTENNDLRGTVGVGLAFGNGKDSTSGNDVESTGININTEWAVSNWSILGEFFTRTDDHQNGNDEEQPTGWAASVGYLMPKSGDSTIQWGFGARVSMIETDNGDNGSVSYLTGGAGIGGVDGDVTEISAVINAFYHGHAAKTQFEYTLQDVGPTGGTDATNHILRIGFQLMF